MSSETPLILIDGDDIRIKGPPDLGGEEERAEIRILRRAISGASSADKDFANIADRKPVDIFKSFCQKNNLPFDDEYFRDLNSQLKTPILKLKYRFNRPRPWQIDRSQNTNSYDSAKTPAYPSGHAIQSHTIANILSKLYPKFKESLKMLADRISLSRIQAGVHYPSDIFTGEEVANMLEQYIIDPIEARRDMTHKNDFRSITRSFLREAYQEPPEKLRILDFDDTIANTVERVLITTDNGRSHKLISSEDFAVYDLKPGESIDPNIAFEEFGRVDVEKATPVPVISDMLKSFASAQGSRKLLILTARSQEVANDVMSFLQSKLGIQNPSGTIDFVGVASKEPSAKVEIIQQYLDSNPSINFVSFYDDSGKNVRAVHDFLDERGFSRGRDQRDVRQVVKDEDGSIRLVMPEDLDERIDERSITRNFLGRFF